MIIFSNNARYFLRLGLVLLLALLTNYYFSLGGGYWLVISAFLVVQASGGFLFRKTLQIAFFIISAMLVSSLLIFIQQPILTLLILIIMLGCGGYFVFRDYLLTTKNFFLILFLIFTLLYALSSPTATSESLYNRIVDVVLGVTIGCLSQLIIPVHLVRAMHQSIVPVLKAMIDELQLYINEQNQNKLEDILIPFKKIYPEWVYETGFNPRLRSSWRFFLVYLDQVIEIVFVMRSQREKIISLSLFQKISSATLATIQTNVLLLQILLHYFQQQNIHDVDHDFNSDIVFLEQQLKQILPSHLALIDLAEEYLQLLAYVRDIKDMRVVLLKLLSSLNISPRG